MPTKFKYIDRGKKDLLVLIPGWASDYRIFSCLDLEFNYLLPFDFSPFDFQKRFLDLLIDRHIEKVSLLGWSLGSFVAFEFAVKYGILIDNLILVSTRKRYSPEELRAMKHFLNRNKTECLTRFYAQCFAEKKTMLWFKENLLQNYCKELKADYLLRGLEYLEKAEINPGLLKPVNKIKLIHGEFDRIAPIAEAKIIKQGLVNAEFSAVRNGGHIPFLNKEFPSLCHG